MKKNYINKTVRVILSQLLILINLKYFETNLTIPLAVNKGKFSIEEKLVNSLFLLKIVFFSYIGIFQTI